MPRGAAFEVGYESASQFNREYKRFFGQPADAGHQKCVGWPAPRWSATNNPADHFVQMVSYTEVIARSYDLAPWLCGDPDKVPQPKWQH